MGHFVFSAVCLASTIFGAVNIGRKESDQILGDQIDHLALKIVELEHKIEKLESQNMDRDGYGIEEYRDIK